MYFIYATFWSLRPSSEQYVFVFHFIRKIFSNGKEKIFNWGKIYYALQLYCISISFLTDVSFLCFQILKVLSINVVYSQVYKSTKLLNLSMIKIN